MSGTDWEVRMGGLDLRVSGSGTSARLTGYPIVFNVPSLDLGGFTEIIRSEAVERSLRERLDIRALVDHDPSRILGRTSANTLWLSVDAHGLKMDLDPPPTTTARDLLVSIERGDVTGMSFAFRTLDDRWSEQDGQEVREVLDMLVREVSIVSFPAYPQTDVSVAQRSLAIARGHRPGRSLGLARRLHKLRLA